MTTTCTRTRIRKRPGAALGLLALLAAPSTAFVAPTSRPNNYRLQHLSSSSASSSTASVLQGAAAAAASDSRRSQSTATSTTSIASIPLDRQIVNLGRQGHTDDALQLFRSIRSPTLRQVNAAIDACGRSRVVRLETAFQLLREYCQINESRADTSNSDLKKQHQQRRLLLQPNVYTFGALMSVCARARNVDQALQVFDIMRDCHVQPNGVVYNAAISAAAKSERPDLAMQLLHQAKQQNVQLTVVGYNAAISASAKTAQWQMALELLTSMQQHGPQPDAVTYGTVLAACEKAEQWPLVMQQAQEMRRVGGFQWDGIAITSVLHACQQLGLWQEALEYLQLMKTVDSYTRKTMGWEIAGNKQPLQGPDAVAYRLALSACARGGAWKEGIKLLKEYCELFDGGDVMAYTSAILGCRYEGHWVQAFALLDRMRQSGIAPNEITFAATIHACATATAKLVSSGAFQLSNDESTVLPDPHVKAMKLLNILKKDTSTPNPNIQVYNAAIRSCAEALDVDRAFVLFDEIRSDGIESNIMTFGELMTACERSGDTERASQVFKMMRECGLEPNEIIYGAAISCCRKAGESERALLLLKKMVRESLKPNVAVFNTVLMAQAEAKIAPEVSMERAMTVYKILKSSEYAAASPNRQTYNILARTMAAKGDPRQAESFLRQMRADGFVPDVDLYTATVSSFERKGQPLKALRIMDSMRADGYDFYEFPVLNAAFKKAVSLVNAVGRGLSSSDEEVDDSD